MAHLRSQIRAAVVTRVTSLATTGANVFDARVYPLHDAELPALCVYTRSDVPDYEAGALAQTPTHELELHIEGYVKGDSEATADLIAEEVETALYGSDNTFGGLIHGLEIGETELRVDGEGDELITIVDMTYTVFYRAVEGAPAVAA